NSVAALVARNFAASGGELRVGDVPVSVIAERYGTPLYVYDLRVLHRQWRRLRDALPSEFDIAYSVKANPNPAILGEFLATGCALEIASTGEFSCALRAECPPSRMLFAGPGKTESELELALKAGIGEVHIESRLELERVLDISRQLGIQAPVALRVNP